MKKFILSAALLSVALPAALPAALAQATQTRAPAATGTDVLKAILKAKGLVLTDAQVAAILAGLQPGSASAGPYAALLGISPESLTALLSAKTAAVPPAVALKAILEAARPAPKPGETPKPVSLAAVQQLLASNPSLFTGTVEAVAKLVADPVAASALANRAEVIANAPVTPRGGGN